MAATGELCKTRIKSVGWLSNYVEYLCFIQNEKLKLEQSKIHECYYLCVYNYDMLCCVGKFIWLNGDKWRRGKSYE